MRAAARIQPFFLKFIPLPPPQAEGRGIEGVGKWDRRSPSIKFEMCYIPFSLFLVALGFYLYTLAPSLNWADGARMQLDVMFGGSTYYSFEEASQVKTDGLPFDRLGVAAWDHPLYVMLGQLVRLLPWKEPTYGLNLMSALFGALVVALVYAFCKYLGAGKWPAALGALALAVSHTFWIHAVTSEVYTLNLAFMVSLVWIAVRWGESPTWNGLLAFAFLSGLGLSNHVMLAITIVIAASYMVLTGIQKIQTPHAWFSYKRYALLLSQRNIRMSLALLCAFSLGFSPWWIQFIRMARLIGFPLTLQVAAGFPWLGNRMAVRAWWAVFANLLGYGGWLLYQFTPAGVALGVYGFIVLKRRNTRVFWFFLALMIVHFMFSSNYAPADQFNFHLPSFLILALAISFGVAGLFQRLDANLHTQDVLKWATNLALPAALILAPIWLYASLPGALKSMGVSEQKFGVYPIGTGARDTLAYFLNPNKRGDDSAARFGRSTLEELAPNALVFTPKTTDQEAYVILRYVQLIEGMRPDVRLDLLLFEPPDDITQALYEQAIAQQGCRPLYITSLNPRGYPLEQLFGEFDIVPEANLYRLLPKQVSHSPQTCSNLDQSWSQVPLEELIRRAMRRQ
jgi:Protein O-mannosyl-transferase TMEM260-like